MTFLDFLHQLVGNKYVSANNLEILWYPAKRKKVCWSREILDVLFWGYFDWFQVTNYSLARNGVKAKTCFHYNFQCFKSATSNQTSSLIKRYSTLYWFIICNHDFVELMELTRWISSNISECSYHKQKTSSLNSNAQYISWST